jgi:hypothetical protein
MFMFMLTNYDRNGINIVAEKMILDRRAVTNGVLIFNFYMIKVYLF